MGKRREVTGLCKKRGSVSYACANEVEEVGKSKCGVGAPRAVRFDRAALSDAEHRLGPSGINGPFSVTGFGPGCPCPARFFSS